MDSIEEFKNKYSEEIKNNIVVGGMINDLCDIIESSIDFVSINTVKEKAYECFDIMAFYLLGEQNPDKIERVRYLNCFLDVERRMSEDIWEYLKAEDSTIINRYLSLNIYEKFPEAIKYFTFDNLVDNVEDFFRKYAETKEIKEFLNIDISVDEELGEELDEEIYDCDPISSRAGRRHSIKFEATRYKRKRNNDKKYF